MDAASELLTSVGFLLVPGAPFEHGPAYLMIALRPKPTLAHFDPERIEYWTVGSAGSQPSVLEWPIADAAPVFSVGLDPDRRSRSGPTTSLPAFGGRLTIAHDGDRHAALFRVRRSDPDRRRPFGSGSCARCPGSPASSAVARAASGDPEVRARLDAADPVAIYAAFVARTLAFFREQHAIGGPSPRVLVLLSSVSSAGSNETAPPICAAVSTSWSCSPFGK